MEADVPQSEFMDPIGVHYPNLLMGWAPQKQWEMICEGTPLFWTVCNHSRVKQSSAEVSWARRILADLESSLGLVVGFINAKYFSMEALRCSHVNRFLMLILVSAAWIWRYLLICLPMSPTLLIFNKDENFCKVVKASCTWEVRTSWVSSTWKTLSWGF